MFGNRLTILREATGKSKKEVAEALNMPYTTYLNYEADLREPSSETLIKIADFYGVSIDYLLGHTQMKGNKKMTYAATILSAKTHIVKIMLIYASDREEAYERFRVYFQRSDYQILAMNKVPDDTQIA